MKIWCVDYAGLSPRINSSLFFTKEEAEDFDKSWSFDGAYHKMYQVEDIWGWCSRHFDEVINEIIASRDNGDNFTLIYGMVEEIREAAEHCGLKRFSIDAFWTQSNDFVLSAAWISEGSLFHRTYVLDALDEKYEHPTIVERRSKWQTEN